MISRKKVVSLPAENRYKSADYEAEALVISTGPSLLLDLYAFNKTGSTVYLAVLDRVDAVIDSAEGTFTTYPIPAGGYISLSNDKGERFANGIVVSTYTDVDCQTVVPSVVKYNIGWSRYV